MFTNSRNSALGAILFVLMSATIAEAQASIGTRAQGMGGAFVGVADDATAVYWNPAGIATGAFVSGVVDFGSAQGEKTGIVGLSATAVGLAYYRSESFGIPADQPAVTGVQGREEVRRSVQAVTTSVAGVSLLHSLSEHMVVGVTPKLVRGVVRDSASTTGDVDAGAMFYADRIRVGVVARNLAAPSFKVSDGGSAIALNREVRAGVAFGSGWSGISRVIVSADADLKTRFAPDGDRRDVAAGVETWWMQQRLGVRGGVSGSTIGDGRAAFAAGLSAGLTQGMLVEAHVTRGHGDNRSWSIGARVMF